MVCDACGVAALICGSRTEVLGDDSGETQTEVFSVLEYQCRNQQCGKCGKPVGETRHKIYPDEAVGAARR